MYFRNIIKYKISNKLMMLQPMQKLIVPPTFAETEQYKSDNRIILQ